MKSIYKILFAFTTLIWLLSASCGKFLEIDPPKNKIKTVQIFENDQIATSAITGIYTRMVLSGFGSGDRSSVTVLGSLSADDLKSHNTSLDGFFQNDISSSSPEVSTVWTNAYAYIYTVNTIVEGLQSASGVTENTRKQLLGEAKFIRAFCYFYLVNLFGDVPLILNPDYRLNEQVGKSSEEQIYAQIISDLKGAENLLLTSYVSAERVRPNKWVAKAMLSRVYLYTKNWDLAKKEATEVIDQKNTYSLVDDLDNVFLKNSTETIWQLMPNTGLNTNEGFLFVLTNTPLFVSLHPAFVGVFESADNRRVKWIKEFNNNTGKYFFPYKYKVQSSTIVSEYSLVIRLAELHLIRAEARINSDEIPLGISDLNLLRKRARPLPTTIIPNPLPDLPLTLNKADALLAVEKERRVELFTEWGHRWFDLKRTGRSSAVLTPLKEATWQETDVLYPIPDDEINRNRNVDQNKGY